MARQYPEQGPFDPSAPDNTVTHVDRANEVVQHPLGNGSICQAHIQGPASAASSLVGGSALDLYTPTLLK